MKSEEGTDQRTYWDQNLDPTNLGTSLADARTVLIAEKDFYPVPDRRAFLQSLRTHKCTIVLELGAGLSYEVIKLLELGYRVIACDLSFARLRLLRQLAVEFLGPAILSRISFVACRAESLPFAPECFSAVATRAVLIHTDLEPAITECARVLNRAGICVFSEPLAHHPLVNIYRKTLAPREWQTIATYFDKQHVQLLRAVFPVVRERHDYLFSFLAFVWQYAFRQPLLFWTFLWPLHLLDQILIRLFPPLRRYAWFVTLICRKSPEK